MAHPTSSRFLPIREAICEVLAAAPALGEVKAIMRDRDGLNSLPASSFPAIGVFFAEVAGHERARWVSNRCDHDYQFEVQVVVRSLESGQVCEDLLFAYLEAVEDALRAAPTLGGLVRAIAGRLVRRVRSKVENYWSSQAVLLVMCEQRIP